MLENLIVWFFTDMSLIEDDDSAESFWGSGSGSGSSSDGTCAHYEMSCFTCLILYLEFVIDGCIR